MTKEKIQKLESIIESFQNIKLEVRRSDLCGADHQDVRSIYLLGDNGDMLAITTAIKDNRDEKYKPFVGDKELPLKWELSDGHIWGCFKGELEKEAVRVKPIGSSFTKRPTKGFYPLELNCHGTLSDMYHLAKFGGEIKDFYKLCESDYKIISELTKKHENWIAHVVEARKMSVKIGQEIYVPSSLYLSHGADDFIGGLAKVIGIEKKNDDIWVSIAEKPLSVFNWSIHLAENQDQWKKEYGNSRAHPDPDLRPEFNMWD